jgi:hypothetical protein
MKHLLHEKMWVTSAKEQSPAHTMSRQRVKIEEVDSPRFAPIYESAICGIELAPTEKFTIALGVETVLRIGGSGKISASPRSQKKPGTQWAPASRCARQQGLLH